MPIYNAIHKRTKKTKEFFLSISELDKWEKDNPDWEVLCGAPGIHSGGGLGLKSLQSDEGFRDKLREIHKHSPNNTLAKQGVKF